jgi:hypothetical protein
LYQVVARSSDTQRPAASFQELRNSVDFLFLPDGRFWADHNGSNGLGDEANRGSWDSRTPRDCQVQRFVVQNGAPVAGVPFVTGFHDRETENCGGAWYGWLAWSWAPTVNALSATIRTATSIAWCILATNGRIPR